MASAKPEAHVSREVQELLHLYSSLNIVDEGKKIKCDLTGHEMPSKVEAIQSYIQGKKFKKLQSQDQFDYDKYKPHLVPNEKKKHQNQMFCKLTLRTFNKQPEHILRHVNGKRFKKALAKWEECQRTGEKYYPRGRRQAKINLSDSNEDHGTFNEMGVAGSDEVDSGDESEADSLSDLYPKTDFSTLEDQEDGSDGSDPDIEEEMENVVEDSPQPSSTNEKGKKRKSEDPKPSKELNPKKVKFEKKGKLKQEKGEEIKS